MRARTWRAAAALVALVLPVGLAAPAGAAGTSYIVQATVRLPAADQVSFGGISCTGQSYCEAVGAVQGMPFAVAESWNGHRWTRADGLRADDAQGTPSSATTLAGVACAHAGDCFAVGDETSSAGEAPVIEHLAGWKWSQQPAPPLAETGGLSAVACASATFCVAVGVASSGGSQIPLIDQWDGHTWSEMTPAHVSDVELSGVSCAAADRCFAVGSHQIGAHTFLPIAERWNGRTWFAEGPPGVKGASTNVLAGVSCPTTTDCTAVGNWSPGSTAQGLHPLVERLSRGHWSLESAPGPGYISGLSGVSCLTASDCTAAGAFGPNGNYQVLVDHWDGSGWTQQSAQDIGDASGLTGISCVAWSGPGLCRGVGNALHRVHGSEHYLGLAEVSS